MVSLRLAVLLCLAIVVLTTTVNCRALDDIIGPKARMLKQAKRQYYKEDYDSKTGALKYCESNCPPGYKPDKPGNGGGGGGSGGGGGGGGKKPKKPPTSGNSGGGGGGGGGAGKQLTCPAQSHCILVTSASMLDPDAANECFSAGKFCVYSEGSTVTVTCPDGSQAQVQFDTVDPNTQETYSVLGQVVAGQIAGVFYGTGTGVSTIPDDSAFLTCR